MLFQSGNPAVLNKVQILKSDCVLTAKVTGGEVTRIIDVWKGERSDVAVVLPEKQRFLDGEYIVHAEPVAGYIHRMHEKMGENRKGQFNLSTLYAAFIKGKWMCIPHWKSTPPPHLSKVLIRA